MKRLGDVLLKKHSEQGIQTTFVRYIVTGTNRWKVFNSIKFQRTSWATGRPENKAVTGHRTPKVVLPTQPDEVGKQIAYMQSTIVLPLQIRTERCFKVLISSVGKKGLHAKHRIE